MRARSASWRRARGLLLEIAVPLALLGAWALWSRHSHSFYFPPLVDILDRFHRNWLFGRFGGDALPSLVRLLLGYAIAVVVAVALGVALALRPLARRCAQPIVEFLRAIPPPALLPFAILVIGIGDAMKVGIIAMVCLWPVLLNTIEGVSGVDPVLADTSRSYRVRRSDHLLRVVLPAAGPAIFAGMRTSLALALILMVISEMVASTNGIGHFILESQRTFAVTDMWSGIVLLSVLGYLLNLVFVVIEHRVLRWHRGARTGGADR